MSNLEIRKLAQEKNVALWKIAAKLGITDATFSRQLRFEFSEQKKQAIISIIMMLARED